MDHDTALLSAAAATAFLATVHAVVPMLRRRLGGVGEGIAASIGGGVAAAYVFLHLLPELARGNDEIAEALGDSVESSAVTELLLFVVALAGFVLLYGLDHAAARAGHEEGALFAVHLGVFALYNALITYTLPSWFGSGAAVATLFTVAMALHFMLSDRSLAEHYGSLFSRIGRPVLVAALVLGFLLAWLFAPTRTLVVSVLLAVLAGFVLFNVFSDELPSERHVRFPVFAAAVAGYAGLLIAVTAIEG